MQGGQSDTGSFGPQPDGLARHFLSLFERWIAQRRALVLKWDRNRAAFERDAAIEQGTGASLETLRRMVRGFQRDELVSGLENQGIADARSHIGDQEFIAFCDKNPVLAEMVDSDDPAKIALAIGEFKRAGGRKLAPVDGARAALKADLHGSSMRNRRDPPSGEPTAGDLDREFEEASAAEAKRFGGG